MLPTIRELFALALFAGTFFQILVTLWKLTGGSAGLVLPIAAAAFVAVEAVILNLLSLVRGVRPLPIILVHLALIALLAIRQKRRWPGSYSQLLSLARFRLRSMSVEWMVAPLVILLAITAYAFPPTNWDSMTYHMARVAHWIQNHSVAYYPANHDGQNTMGPGMEYLILLLQIVAWSDRWANSVQLFFYCVLIVGLPSICRQLGLARRWCPWVAVFVAGVPLMTLEATTTQNDLAASVMAVAVVAGGIFIFRARAIKPLAVTLFSICAAATYLVKPTATLAALPVSLIVLFMLLRRVPKAPRRALLLSVAGGLCAFVVVLGPDSYRKIEHTHSLFGGRSEIYPLAGEWKDRAFNSVRAYCQNAYHPSEAQTLIQGWEASLFDGKTSPLFCGAVYPANEDRAGNPLHALVCLVLIAWIPIALVVALLRRRRIALMLALASTVPAAWLVVHAFVRNQQFLSRLQLPIFALSPLLWIPFAWPGIAGWRVRGWALVAASSVCLTFGYVSAFTNELRPTNLPTFQQINREAWYYVVHPALRGVQDAALADVRASTCKRVGFYTDDQHFDYPFSWRAMQSDIAVRPYRSPSRWPCMVYSNLGVPPSDDTVEWRQFKDNLWIRSP